MAYAGLKGRSGENGDISKKWHKHPIIMQAVKKTDILN